MRVDRDAAALPATLHAVLKSPLKRFSFTLSFEKRVAWYAGKRVDVSDPMVQTRIAMEAYKDAQRDLFMQNNLAVDAYRAGVRILEKKVEELGGEESIAGKLTGTALEAAFPVVRVPTNIVGEALENVTGVLGAARGLSRVFRTGVEKLTPDQADLIMRQLSRGLVGGSLLYLGYHNYKDAGGFYMRGQKRGQGDVEPDHIRIFGIDVPKWAIEHPMFLTYQLGAAVHHFEDMKIGGKKQGLPAGIWEGFLGLIDETPFAEQGNLLTAITGGSPGERQSAVGKMLGEMATPGLIQQIAVWTDRDSKGKLVHRSPKTVLDNIKAGIPGLRETVPARRGGSSAALPNLPVRIPAKGPDGKPLSLNLPASQAHAMLSSRLAALKKLRDAIPA